MTKTEFMNNLLKKYIGWTFRNDDENKILEIYDYGIKENGYIFVTANLIDYLKDNLDMKWDREMKKHVYEIKEGKEVSFEAC